MSNNWASVGLFAIHHALLQIFEVLIPLRVEEHAALAHDAEQFHLPVTVLLLSYFIAGALVPVAVSSHASALERRTHCVFGS